MVERPEDHPWGGQSLDVLLFGDLPALLEQHMPPSRFAEWRRGYEQGRIAITGAISFVTDDDRRAVALPRLADREIFLMLAAHEAGETALERRHEAEGHEFREQTHTSLAHVLWTEYAVERTRRQIFEALQLGYSQLDNGFVSEQIEDIAAELPELISYSMSLGRADERSPADIADLAAFRRHPLVRESISGWDALDDVLRRAYEQPDTGAASLDEFVRNEGWMKLYENGLGEVWNTRYAAAGGR